MKNLLLIGDKEFKNYFSKDFNVIIAEFDNDNFQVKEICKRHKIDIIFQIENLNKREIIYDLLEVDCLKIFWAIDIHLNYYWQKDYFENFHIILSSQLNFIHKNSNYKIFWVPWGIHDKYVAKEFIPFERRKHKISFVGLIDENRIKRKNILEIIDKNFKIYMEGTSLKNRISQERMFEIYKNSWIVINESILNDINFRYFEVTSQGAVLYTEKINNGENILFKEKYEFLRYSQLNLIKRLNFYLKYKDILEKIAYNGYWKTKKFHTLSKRIEIIEKIIKKYYYLKNNRKKFKITSITLPLLKTYLRGIGKPVYIKKFVEINTEEKYNILILKLFNKNEFFKKAYSQKNDPLVFMNIVNEEIEKFKLDELISFINFFLKNIPHYFQGHINIFPKSKLMLTVFEFINCIYNTFNKISLKNKKINHISASILMKNKNFQSAIIYLLNLQREFPENTLFRKMLAKCFFEIYALDLWKREVLKIFLLERKFDYFKLFKEDDKIKKEIIFEIITHIKDKKLIRDILFEFEN